MKIIEATDSNLREQFYALRRDNFDLAHTSYRYTEGETPEDKLSRIFVAVDDQSTVVAGIRAFVANRDHPLPLTEKLPFNLNEKLQLLGCDDFQTAELGSAVVNKKHPDYSGILIFKIFSTCSKMLSEQEDVICFSRQADPRFTNLIKGYCEKHDFGFAHLGKIHSPNALGETIGWDLITTSSAGKDRFPLEGMEGTTFAGLTGDESQHLSLLREAASQPSTTRKTTVAK